MTSSVSNYLKATTASSADTSASLPTQTLSQNDFLQLLVTQMSSQDPMNPQSNTDFAAQMAQFTALAETNTMSSNISTMSSNQLTADANSMIGRQVVLQPDNSKDPVTGVVSGVDLSSGAPQVVVNGTSYDLSTVLAVTQPSTQ